MSTVDFTTLQKADLDTPNPASYIKNQKLGLSEAIIQQISSSKNEPAWLLDLRMQAFQIFKTKKMPSWGPSLKDLNLDQIRFFASASDVQNAKKWEDVPEEIKNTFEKLKIPEAERALLAGVGAQYESNNVYHNLKAEWDEKGVIFEDFDVAVQKHPDLVRKYLAKSVPLADHSFAALHYAVMSGGTFLYIPKNVEITQPLQAYFRMNAINQGQFEHTLIIVEENAKGHYIEGCSAPKYGSASLHAGCVEVFVAENAEFRYSSVENWSSDTYNLNTKRAIVQKNAVMEWIGGNLGSGVTMLYPCSVLVGKNARADHLGVAFAGKNQNQDTGAKIIMAAPNTKGTVVSKSLSKDGGICTYRGLIKVLPKAENAIVNIECDALMLDDQSISDTIPYIDVQNHTASLTHEASAGKISQDVLLYLQSRGIAEEDAKAMIVNGFLNEVVKTLPLEYASELNRLIELEMEGSIG